MTKERFLEHLHRQLCQLDELGLRRFPTVVRSLPGGRCRIDGQELINFGSNDYLNLAHHPAVVQRLKECTQVGSTASSLVAGRSPSHDLLEKELAAFEQTESVLLFPTGFAANLGVLGALVSDSDAVFCDRDNHASLIDGVRATGAQMFVYQRGRLEVLQKALARRRGQFENVFIVTDGVFSMDGGVADLPGLCEIGEQSDALIIVDEAHATGVIGSQGRGVCELHGVEKRILVKTGTLSKALGGLGGFAAGSATVIEWLRNRARSQFFSTALPPAICEAMRESLRIVIADTSRRERLREHTLEVHQLLNELGLPTVGSGIAPIIPVIIPEERRCVATAQQLRKSGCFVPAIRPPTVRAGTSRLRISLTSDHQLSDLHSMLETVAECLAS